jgi:hypothetical protein
VPDVGVVIAAPPAEGMHMPTGVSATALPLVIAIVAASVPTAVSARLIPSIPASVCRTK